MNHATFNTSNGIFFSRSLDKVILFGLLLIDSGFIFHAEILVKKTLVKNQKQLIAFFPRLCRA